MSDETNKEETKVANTEGESELSDAQLNEAAGGTAYHELLHAVGSSSQPTTEFESRVDTSSSEGNKGGNAETTWKVEKGEK